MSVTVFRLGMEPVSSHRAIRPWRRRHSTIRRAAHGTSRPEPGRCRRRADAGSIGHYRRPKHGPASVFSRRLSGNRRDMRGVTRTDRGIPRQHACIPARTPGPGIATLAPYPPRSRHGIDNFRRHAPSETKRVKSRQSAIGGEGASVSRRWRLRHGRNRPDRFHI